MKRVVITGMGVISPIGNNIDAYWDSLIKGVCGIGPITQYETGDHPVKLAAEVKDFKAEDFGVDKGMARKSDRFAQFALAAANQAIADSGLKSGENIAADRFGTYIGSGIGGMHVFTTECEKLINEGMNRISPLFIPMLIANMASGQVAIAHHLEGPCIPVVTACATSTHAVGEAFHAIKHGYADAIVAGGSEAAVNPLAIGGFANSKALSKATDPNEASLPFDKRRAGFVMGEGCGILVLEEYEHAKARGAKIYAEVTGYGNTCDAYHYTAPKPDGVPASKAIKLALEESKFDAAKDCLYINAHGTGTPLNDKGETAAFKLALGEDAARKAHISSSKSMMGHCLGAAGALELIVSVLTLKNGIIPPTINLKEADPECDLNYTPNVAVKADVNIAFSTSLGFGGHNGCVALRKM